MSDQMINIDKSEVSFNKGLTPEELERIRDELSMRMVDHHEKYLAFETGSTRSLRGGWRGLCHERERKS